MLAHQFPLWRLSERSDSNLGICCDENGLSLGRIWSGSLKLALEAMCRFLIGCSARPPLRWGKGDLCRRDHFGRSAARTIILWKNKPDRRTNSATRTVFPKMSFKVAIMSSAFPI